MSSGKEKEGGIPRFRLVFVTLMCYIEYMRKSVFFFSVFFLTLSGCMTAKMYRQASSSVEEGAFLNGVYTAAQILDENPRYKKAVSFISEYYTPALQNGEALLKQAALSEEPARTEQRVQIYEKLVKVTGSAAALGLENVSFPDYTADLSQARADAVFLFLSYAQKAVDYRDAHNYGVKALNYAPDGEKSRVRSEMASVLYDKALLLARGSDEQTLLKALDCFTAVGKWDPSYSDISQRMSDVRTRLAELYYTAAVAKSGSASRTELKEAMSLFEKAVAQVPGYKDTAARMARLKDRLTIRVFCYSPDWSSGSGYWRSSSFGYFNGTAVAAEFRQELARRLIGNRYIEFPSLSLNAVIWNGTLYTVQKSVHDSGCDYMVAVTLTLPAGAEVRKRTEDRFRSYRVPAYRVSVKIDQNGVVSTVSDAVVSESAYNRLRSSVGNQSAFESVLRQEGVRLNKPSSGQWYYDIDTASSSVQLTEREYIFEFDLRGTAEVIDLWSGRTVYTSRETKTVYGSAGKEYINLPSSLSHLKTPGFRPDYDMEKALTDSEVETVLSRMASDVAVFLGRQT